MRSSERLAEAPIGFAHRGGRKHGTDNAIETFEQALSMGATGLETDIWLTRDGVAVLNHSGFVRRGPFPRPIPWTDFAALPADVLSLDQLYERLGFAFDLSVDVKAGIAGAEAIAIATEVSAEAISRMWLCHWDMRRLRAWRISSARVRLVNSVRRITIREGILKRARRLAAWGVDALNLRADEWSAEDVAELHSQGVLAFGWNAHNAETIQALLEIGIDAVYSDDVETMVRLLGK